jgi:uncharacterized sulfatase
MRPGLRYSKREFLGLGLAACACGVCGGANPQALKYELEATEIAKDTWAVFGAREYFSTANGGNIVNTAFAVVPDGLIVIDTGPSRRYGQALLELIAQKAPGKRVLRVFNTHHHPDHFLGNQAFDRSVIAAPQGVIDNIVAEGSGFADNMYRLVGDWMRGTSPVAPGIAIESDGEEIGGRRFSYLALSGHTSSDFVIRDEETGVVFAGDLAFLDRAPTTPHANLPAWRQSIAALRSADKHLLLPGHGPADSRGEALDQTLDYLDWLDGTLRDAVRRGLTMNEAMLLPIPERFSILGVVREEFGRSVIHLYPGLENELFEAVPVER